MGHTLLTGILHLNCFGIHKNIEYCEYRRFYIDHGYDTDKKLNLAYKPSGDSFAGIHMNLLTCNILGLCIRLQLTPQFQ